MKRRIIALASLAILNPFHSTPGTANIDGFYSVFFDQDPGPPQTQIKLEPVLENLDQPLFITGARDGSNRLFIVERPGRIKVLLPGTASPLLFLDITEKVRAEGEGGLLGLAFHPNHNNNRRFFICYSRVSDGATVVVEYRVSKSDSNSVKKIKERLILVIPQPSDIHHGGMIDFGPDNLLYISTGDGEWEDPDNSAQDKEDLRGKILRIDVDQTDAERAYSSASSNPFFGDIPGRDEVYALGFRNPWRFAFDRLSGDLYVGDVGHEQREEINIVNPGGNYGWRIFEGSRCTGFEPPECNSLNSIAPLVEYFHTDGRCSVTGGCVYRGDGSSLPSGSYMFGDFCTGEIFLLSEGTQQLLLDTDLNIASFGEDDGGEIYVVGLGGTLHRVKAVLPTPQIDSAQVRRRSDGEILQPLTVKQNGKKFEVVIHGSGLVPGSSVFVSGRGMRSVVSMSQGTELIARLRHNTLANRGNLVIEVVNPDGIRSNAFTIKVE